MGVVKEQEKIRQLEEQLKIERQRYEEIANSFYWRATKPFRFVTHRLKMLLYRFKYIKYFCLGLKILFTKGVKEFLNAVRVHFHIVTNTDFSKITKKQREFEESFNFNNAVKFSILVPLYNTPVKYLKQMLLSVQNQTYKNWELCLADGSDCAHLEKTVKAFGDNRIIYKKLKENKGISENTNECIKMATGDYLCLFDHDDILHPSALFECMKAIENENPDFIYTDEATFKGNNIRKIINFHFKPDFAPDNLRAVNYICHFTVFSKELQEKTGFFNSRLDGSQDHDMILRLTENAKKIYHIKELLYFWRSHKTSVAENIGAKSYAVEAGKKAVLASINRMGYDAEVMSSKAFSTMYRIKYELKINPQVSIIIPNMNHLEDLQKCVESVLTQSTYQNYEIIIVENNSNEADIFDYYKELEQNPKIKVVTYKGEFNYPKINNFGINYAKGEYLLLLNNDTEVITPEWLEEMLMYAQREDVGIVGGKLYYPDNTVQHAGVIVGLGGVAGHTHLKADKEYAGYMGKMFYSQNVSAVTGACLMIKAEVYERTGGLDPDFAVAFNDVDLCLKVGQLGLLTVFTPYCELYHYESKSRGYEDTPEKQERFLSETKLFKSIWGDSVLKQGDPYYNPHFSYISDYKVLYDSIKRQNFNKI